MARLTVDLELEQVRAIVGDLDRMLDPVGFERLRGGVSDVYRIDLAGTEGPLVLKIYADEPQWIVAKEALIARWIDGRAGLPIPRWLRVDESRTRIPFRFALTTWLPGVTVRSLISAPGSCYVVSRQPILMPYVSRVLGEGERDPSYQVVWPECLQWYRLRLKAR